MKVLWIVNTIFPAPSKSMGLAVPVFGGWMYSLAVELSKSLRIELAVATTYKGKELKFISIEGIDYFLLPSKNKTNYEVDLEKYWEQVCNNFKPNIVHIHGTEYAHGLACMRKLPELKYVVSIQGLISVIARYYFSGISFWELFKNITLRDLIRRDTTFQAKSNFEKRGIFEVEYLKRTKHVIGRTKWDFAHTKALNSKVNYHFCNESLRDGFYKAKKWSFNNCEPYTLFLSQAGYPIKGLHQLIQAVALLKIEYPDLKIRLGGSNITNKDSFEDKLKRSGYGKYIGKLLKKYKLDDDVVFLGTLSEEQMIKEYLAAHIFICPSSIENSPNSLGEAQLLGVPVIAAYVGGIPDMIEDRETGLLYRFEEVEMLMEEIRCVFKDNNFASKLSLKGIEAATLRHHKNNNLESTIAIYNTIDE
jgi:glycosyltransferase involved in cell wall biosynthesis